MNAAQSRLFEAMALLSAENRLRADRLRARYQRRNERLQRRKLAIEQKRKQALLDPVARALAKAQALSKSAP